MRNALFGFGFVLLSIIGPGIATCPAAPYTIDWHSVAGGGGVSTGGVFTVSGTIGQPNTGSSAGGNYLVTGGFWGVVAAVQTPGAPFLSVVRNPTNGFVTVSWPLPAAGFLLDETAVLSPAPGNWAQVASPYQTNATHISITVPSPSGNRYYRLRKP